MVASICIVVVSTALFLYWFRYTSLLILNTSTVKDYSAEVAETNRLSFIGAQDRLGQASASELEMLQRSLERDYRIVSSLLRQAGELKVGGNTLEDFILRVDFRLMAIAYSLARGISETRSRAALQEMSLVVAHMANAFGEQVAGSSEA